LLLSWVCFFFPFPFPFAADWHRPTDMQQINNWPTDMQQINIFF
jgi:hypothetical protein